LRWRVAGKCATDGGTLAHLLPFFGKMRPENITTDVLMSYREHRGGEETNMGTFPSESTINRELSLLRNAMRTAAMKTPPLIRLSCIPRFPITNQDECDSVLSICESVQNQRLNRWST